MSHGRGHHKPIRIPDISPEKARALALLAAFAIGVFFEWMMGR